MAEVEDSLLAGAGFSAQVEDQDDLERASQRSTRQLAPVGSGV